MGWFFLALVAALGLILVRVYVKLRAARSSRRESWDEQIVGRLRSQGYAPFNDYRADFFLALPDDAACQAARVRLEPGFSVDVKPLENDTEPFFSMHTMMTLRLVAPEIQGICRLLGALAAVHQGLNDGYAA